MYIIKGIYKSRDVYFVDFYTNPKTNLNVMLLSLTLEGATKYQNLRKVTEKCLTIKSDEFNIYNVCPSCNKEYNEPIAISRRDNKTYICSNCGIEKQYLIS